MIEFAKISTKLRRFLVDFLKIRAVAKPILADFKARMRVVSRSRRAAFDAKPSFDPAPAT